MSRKIPRLRLVVNRDDKPDSVAALSRLTTAIVMAKAEAGTLDPAIVAALLVAVGVPV